MAIVSHILGDCPGCGAKNAFGHVDVYSTYVYLGCGRCRYNEKLPLPPIKKKLLYLDQFFFSHAVRGNDPQFTEAADRISRLADYQMLVVPYSNIHEDETHQWAEHEKLLEFIKRTSRGYEFSPAYRVEQAQLYKAFKAWRDGEPVSYVRERRDVLRDDLDKWDSYYFIGLDGYHGNAEQIRELKGQAIEGLVDIFPGWRTSNNTFEEDMGLEHNAAARGYCDAYAKYLQRVMGGDFMAELDSPIRAFVIRDLAYTLPKDEPIDRRTYTVIQFLASDHFRATPFHDIEARMFATLKNMVKGGAYQNRNKSIQRLSGFYYDVKHIATYASYCDAFLMDNPMAEIVGRDTVALEERYGVKVFCRNNWLEFLDWLDGIKDSIPDEQREALPKAYPYLQVI